MQFFKRASRGVGLFNLLLAMSFANAASSTSYPDLTDFQRMSWLFYHHNLDTISISTAAEHFGKLHAQNITESGKCSQINRLSQSESFDVQEFYRNEFYLLRDEIDPAQLSDQFTAIVTISNAYDSYDKSSQSLAIKGFEQIPSQFFVDSYSKNNTISNHNPCKTSLEPQSTTGANIMIPVPGRFKIDFYRALQESINDISHLIQHSDIQTSTQLRQVPIDENTALELLNRPSIDRNMDILINYKFKSRRPQHETDAKGRQNTLIQTAHASAVYSLPTHSIDILDITYIDTITRNKLMFVSFDQGQNDAPEQTLHYQIFNSPSINPDYSPKYQNAKLPDGLRFFEDAIVFRNDDLTLYKTPSKNRFALTVLNQQLALSAGLPDLTNPENGLYIADTLGDRASKYFTLSDIRTVQPHTYNVLLEGKNQELSVAMNWREDIPKNILLESFKRNEIPHIENFSLTFPIHFMELREVLVQPYDSEIGGFPLLYFNGNSNMRLNDLRKPTINLDAKLPEKLPTHWKLSLPDAELFVERYYQFNFENNGKKSTGTLKKIILASHYKMSSVKAQNTTIVADMKLQQRSLYFSDQLSHKLVTLPRQSDN